MTKLLKWRTLLASVGKLTSERLRILFKKYWHLLVCMAAPALIMYLIYLVRGIHPFGDGCVLVLDLNGQYVWYFEAFRNALRGDADLLYSFSRALGGEFLGMFAYYIASPLSYLLCLFPRSAMLEGLLFLLLTKVALCGGTFGYYVHKTAKTQSRFATILFSSFYALSAYAVVQQNNTMWIDALIWLPLLTLGLENLIKYGKFKLYVLSLAATVVSNFYIGYMVCMWCVLYALIYYIGNAEDHRNNPFYEKLHFLRTLLRMLLYSLLAVGIAAVLILGAYYSLNFGKTTFSDPDWTLKTTFDLLDFFYKLLPGSYDTVRPEGLPFVYCGMLTLLLIPAYFLSKKYTVREKLLSGVLLFVLYLTAAINVTDLIWHGFQAPNWLNYRYSFMISFYLCVLACRAFADLEGLSLRTTAITCGAVAILCAILQKYTDGEYVEPHDFFCIYFSLALLLLYPAALAILKSGKRMRVARTLLSVTVAAELFLNGLICICLLDMDVGYSRYSYYNDFLDNVRPLTERVQASDDSFYRMEKTVFRRTNDNLALGIYGLSGSTSTLNRETIQLLNKMGYSSHSHVSKYVGGTPVNDSLLGVKYVISDKKVYADYYDVYLHDPTTGYTVYKNPYALSIAYGVSSDVLDFKLGFLPIEDKKKENGASVDAENDELSIELGGISNAAHAIKNALNKLLGIEEMGGDKYEDSYNSPFERLNGMVTAMLGEDEPVRIFLPIQKYEIDTQNVEKRYYEANEHGYVCTSDTLDGTVTYTVSVAQDGELYFNMPTDFPREVTLALSVNGGEFTDCGTFNGNESACILSLGAHKAGDVLALRMTIDNESRALYIKSNEHCFYFIDWTVLKDAMSRLGAHQLRVTDYTDRSFEGTYTAANKRDLVMTTIPYDSGWKILVDGKQVDNVKAFGGLIAFYVDGDVGETHKISMVYDPPVVKVGLIISFASLFIFIGLIVLDRFHRLGCRDRRAELAEADASTHTTETPTPPKNEEDGRKDQ